MLSFPMPFAPCPCSIWLARYGEADDYGNIPVTYSDAPDIRTRCCYSPGGSKPETRDDIEDGRPFADVVDMTFYLPKSLVANLRGALIACHPASDPALSSQVFRVVGNPYSYPRESTPGDYSWCVEAVTYLG